MHVLHSKFQLDYYNIIHFTSFQGVHFIFTIAMTTDAYAFRHNARNIYFETIVSNDTRLFNVRVHVRKI